MVHRTLSGLAFALLFALSACQFDGSASLSEDDLDTDTQVDAGSQAVQGCQDFVPKLCGDCGIEVCTDGSGETLIDCVPRSGADLCADDQVCESDGSCRPPAAAPECLPDELRACGDCGQESCIDGQWSECQAVQGQCVGDQSCLQAEPNRFECAITCSTEGHREPCTGQGPIPDFVALGTSWNSHDACLLSDGCRHCSCVVGLFGEPVVHCELFCGVD